MVNDNGNEVLRKAAIDNGDNTYSLRTSGSSSSSGGVSEDSNNTTNTPLNNGSVFTGEWSDRTTPILIMAGASDTNFTWVAQFAVDQAAIDGGDIDSSLPYSYTAGAINIPKRLVISRAKFRIVITNGSGSNQTYLRFQTSLGDYPPLASKLNAALPVDADAEVVRSIQAGQQPDGDYVNVRADGGAVDVDDNDVLTSSTLSAGATYTSGWTDTDGFKSIELSIKADQVSADDGIVCEYTNDANAVTPVVDLTKTFTFNADSLLLGDLTILIPPRLDGFRLKYINGAVDQGSFLLMATLRTAPVQSVELPISSDINKNTNANITRTVTAGVDPDGDFHNSPQSGVFTAGSTTTPLLAGEEFVGAWLDASAYANLSISIVADQEYDDTAYTDTSGTTGGVVFDISSDGITADYTFAIDTLTNPPFHFLKTKPFLKYARLRYTNGATDQNSINLLVLAEVNASPEPITHIGAGFTTFSLAASTRSAVFGVDQDDGQLKILPLIPAGTEISNSTNTLVTKNVQVAEDVSGIYGRIQRFGNSLLTALTRITTDISKRPSTTYITGQVNADSSTPIQIPKPLVSEISQVRQLRISNPSASSKIFFGKTSGVTKITGDFLTCEASETFDFGDDLQNSVTSDDVWVITDGAVTSTQTDNLSADTIDSNSGTVDPSNAYTSNDSRAIFDDVSDTFTMSGFDATGASLLAAVQTVKIKMEARKEPSAPAMTSAFISTVGQDAGNTLSITSPTVTSDADDFYIVSVSRRDEFALITQINDTMGFDSWTLIGDTGTDSAESRTSVYYAAGTPTGNGTVTASFSQSGDHSVIAVTRFSNIDKSSPVNSFTVLGANTNAGYSGSLTDGTENGQYVMCMGFEQGSHNAAVTPLGATERFQDGSTAGNDQIHNVVTNVLASSGSLTFSGTTVGNADISYVAFTLNPAPAIDPVIEVSHSEGSTVLSATLSSESDTNYEVDITADATWTTSLIDNMTMTLTPTTIGVADAEIDRAWVEVTSSSSVQNVCYSWFGDRP